MARPTRSVSGRPAGASARRRRGGASVASPRGLPEFERLVHERVRLGILSALAVNEVLSFVELKTLLDTTDGNLAVHAQKLEQATYVRCTKSFAGRASRSEYRLTAKGRRALESYLDRMDALIKATRRA